MCLRLDQRCLSTRVTKTKTNAKCLGCLFDFLCHSVLPLLRTPQSFAVCRTSVLLCTPFQGTSSGGSSKCACAIWRPGSTCVSTKTTTSCWLTTTRIQRLSSAFTLCSAYVAWSFCPQFITFSLLVHTYLFHSSTLSSHLLMRYLTWLYLLTCIQ